MKKQICLSGMLALTLLLSGCGGQTESSETETTTSETTTDTTSETTDTTTETTDTTTETTAETTAAQNANTDGDTSYAASDDSTAAAETTTTARSDADAAMIRDLAEKGLKAVQDMDIAGMIQYTDIELSYYAAFDKYPDPDTLTAEMEDAIAEAKKHYDTSLFALFDHVQGFDKIEHAADVVPFIKLYLKEGLDGAADYFKIDDVYRISCKIDPSADADDMEEMRELYVVHINGEWRFDIELFEELYYYDYEED